MLVDPNLDKSGIRLLDLAFFDENCTKLYFDAKHLKTSLNSEPFILPRSIK